MLSVAKKLYFEWKAVFSFTVFFNNPLWWLPEGQGPLFCRVVRTQGGTRSVASRGLCVPGSGHASDPPQCPGQTCPGMGMTREVTGTVQGREAHAINLLPQVTVGEPHFAPCNFKRDLVVLLLFHEHKHSSRLFHKLHGEQRRLFLPDTRRWFSDDLHSTRVRISWANSLTIATIYLQGGPCLFEIAFYKITEMGSY